MRRLNLMPLLLLLTAACARERAIEQHIDRTWPAAEVQRLVLKSFNSDVHVNGGAPAVHVIADITSDGERDEHDSPVSMKLEGGVLTISETSYGEGKRLLPWLMRKRRDTIEYSLEVPAALPLSVTTVSGSIDVQGVDAFADLQSVNGSIEVDTRGATLSARTVNGPIEARFAEAFHGAKLRTVNGPVEVSVPASAACVANVSQVNGGFESNIPVAKAGMQSDGPELEVTTVNGDITLTREGAPPVPPPPPAPPTP